MAMNIDNKKANQESLEKTPHFLLDTLANEISKTYLVKLDIISGLLKKETQISLEEFKKDFQENGFSENSKENTPSNEKIEDLYFAIKWAKETLKNATQSNIDKLKEELWEWEKNNFTFLSKKVLPENLFKRIENPENISDQITGLCVWVINSSETLIRILVDIGKGILYTPRDIYLILSWKGKYEMPNV